VHVACPYAHMSKNISREVDIRECPLWRAMWKFGALPLNSTLHSTLDILLYIFSGSMTSKWRALSTTHFYYPHGEHFIHKLLFR
jgi:hypothetical protein